RDDARGVGDRHLDVPGAQVRGDRGGELLLLVALDRVDVAVGHHRGAGALNVQRGLRGFETAQRGLRDTVADLAAARATATGGEGGEQDGGDGGAEQAPHAPAPGVRRRMTSTVPAPASAAPSSAPASATAQTGTVSSSAATT